MITQIGIALIIAAPLAFVGYLLGHWHGKRTGRWERQVDALWDTGDAPVDMPPAETVVYAADDDTEWLAGIKSRTDAFIALHCTQ